MLKPMSLRVSLIYGNRSATSGKTGVVMCSTENQTLTPSSTQVSWQTRYGTLRCSNTRWRSYHTVLILPHAGS